MGTIGARSNRAIGAIGGNRGNKSNRGNRCNRRNRTTEAIEATEAMVAIGTIVAIGRQENPSVFLVEVLLLPSQFCTGQGWGRTARRSEQPGGAPALASAKL